MASAEPATQPGCVRVSPVALERPHIDTPEGDILFELGWDRGAGGVIAPHEPTVFVVDLLATE